MTQSARDRKNKGASGVPRAEPTPATEFDGRAVGDAPASNKRSLRQAVVTALFLLGLMIVCYLLGTRAFFVLICSVVLLAEYELLTALKGAGHRPSVLLGLAGGLGMLTIAYLERLSSFGIVLALTLVAGFLWALRPQRGNSAGTDVAWLLMAVAWVGGGGAGAVLIMLLGPHGLNLLFAVVGCIAIGDIAAYFVGTAIGKRKMAPSISPGKSWEGFAAQIVGALSAGAVSGAVLDELDPLQGLLLGALCGLLAPVGDLIESMVKREIGIKDSSRLLPGHGGFLDRLDAILFCCPAAYLYLNLAVF